MSTEAGAGTGIETDVEAARRDLQERGITACPGAFPASWVHELRADVDAAFEEAMAREGGAVGRGPQ
ncbi:MAG: hypothetical protein QOK15_3146, partial [Nocardioidaceae bacterium]|nr:hypothetical protein [Nocardioidaceae bacterium]